MLHQISTYINKHNLLQPGDTVIVGLSGGADSVALLHILKKLNYACIAAHCNFRLRGEESDQDEAFARRVADSLRVHYLYKDFNTINYATDNHISIEMAARELRYKWFEELRIALDAKAIAVGHHRDDNVETVLMNLIRGTGIRGIRGIRPERDHIIRPLLETGRHEIIDWLRQQNISYRVDSTNLTDEFMRNYIRLHILPMLQKINPDVNETIARTARNLTEVEEIYTDYIINERNRLMDKDIRIDIAGLKQSIAPRTVLFELLKPFGFTRIISDEIYNSLTANSGKIFFAPVSNYQLVKDRDFLLLTEKLPKDNTIYTLQANDSIELPIRLISKTVSVNSDFKLNKDKTIAYFDFNKLTFPLTLRTWRRGDWFIPFGMRGRKKISDYFIDNKYDRNKKEQIWLMCSDSDIIWIVGERIDNRFIIDKSTSISCIISLL
ncbi:MAG: tRNA lysidine(34) synthetase TilS [Tannerella sp.]|nr:tRNA lysidine(34) synthetase TilS [Tannerella sp.]